MNIHCIVIPGMVCKAATAVVLEMLCNESHYTTGLEFYSMFASLVVISFLVQFSRSMQGHVWNQHE